jgi:hypothetical protein
MKNSKSEAEKRAYELQAEIDENFGIDIGMYQNTELEHMVELMTQFLNLDVCTDNLFDNPEAKSDSDESIDDDYDF